MPKLTAASRSKLAPEVIAYHLAQDGVLLRRQMRAEIWQAIRERPIRAAGIPLRGVLHLAFGGPIRQLFWAGTFGSFVVHGLVAFGIPIPMIGMGVIALGAICILHKCSSVPSRPTVGE
jgi:hypothetical protein